MGGGTKAEKTVLNPARPENMRLAMEGMMTYGVFNEPKSLLGIVNHLYINRGDKEKERQVLEELVKEGKLAFSKVLT